MKGIQIEEQGGPEVMQWVDLPEPIAAAGQIIVELGAAGLNYIDTYQRDGLYSVQLPYVLGLEGAGTVIEVGDGVDHIGVGDRVAWASAPSSYAERAAVPADKVMIVPEGIDDEIAAALPLQGMTAHYLALDSYALGPDDRCLIHAGAGGVGLLLIQIAKLRGAEVFTTVGTPDKADLATAAGADHTILYRDVDFADAVREIAGEERPLDVVYDGVGKSVFDASLGLIRKRGMMVTFGNASGPVDPISPLVLSQNGSLFLTRPTLFDHVTTAEQIQRRADDLYTWHGAGDLDVRIGARYSMSDAADAHRALEARTTTGKVLLLP
jgi:NADPH2:quinone reductase